MSEVLHEALTKLVLAIVAIAGWYLATWLRARFSAEQLAKAVAIAKHVVEAVEQISAALGIKGRDKFDETLGRVRDMAARYGITLTDSQWESLIEIAVREWTPAAATIRPVQ